MNVIRTEYPTVDFEERHQKYKNVESHEEAALLGADVIELKYDGWWGRLVVDKKVGSVYSRQGELKHTAPLDVPNCVLLGEFLKGTQRVVSGAEGLAGTLMVFDVLSFEKRCYIETPWFVRKRAIRGVGGYGAWLQPVASYGFEFARSLWDTHVEGGSCEGLIYRNVRDVYLNSTLYRMKKEFTIDYVVMGYYEGKGKHAGKLGGIYGGLYVGGVLVQKCKVGGGYSDTERRHIWDHPEEYLGRVLECTGWQVFDSGAIRHPNAARDTDTGVLKWRTDKRPQECTWAI